MVCLSSRDRVEGSLAARATDDVEPRRPVLLELFTSQGCSSCPRADALLTEFAETQPFAGVELIPLSLHVDYWNRLGWTDPFSHPKFSGRQRDYADSLPERGRVYTPQLVVDGRFGIVGSDRSGARRAVASLAKEPYVRLIVKPRKAPGVTEIEVDVQAEPDPRFADRDAELFVALTEDGLTSDVPRGENAGRRLAHTSVVRILESLGTVTLSAHESATRTVRLSLEREWSPDELYVVAWLQDQRKRVVLGATRAYPF